ncbi:hypothetical protein CHARACLAT_008713 [Characodon lateralis]|uniref:Uncharacterized protein n=1 Tax=Characodon lateralis TaxID=208331 RepID=A0ABU7EHH2_9TELE|nr:hypothetical protein [Characodon lateralis]
MNKSRRQIGGDVWRDRRKKSLSTTGPEDIMSLQTSQPEYSMELQMMNNLNKFMDNSSFCGLLEFQSL